MLDNVINEQPAAVEVTGVVRKTRNGKPSGTSIIIEILKNNGGRMKIGDLRQAAIVHNVKSPFSSVQSLVKTHLIRRDGKDVVLG